VEECWCRVGPGRRRGRSAASCRDLSAVRRDFRSCRALAGRFCIGAAGCARHLPTATSSDHSPAYSLVSVAICKPQPRCVVRHLYGHVTLRVCYTSTALFQRRRKLFGLISVGSRHRSARSGAGGSCDISTKPEHYFVFAHFCLPLAASDDRDWGTPRWISVVSRWSEHFLLHGAQRTHPACQPGLCGEGSGKTVLSIVLTTEIHLGAPVLRSLKLQKKMRRRKCAKQIVFWLCDVTIERLLLAIGAPSDDGIRDSSKNVFRGAESRAVTW